MRSIVLYLITNLAVLLVAGIVLNIVGLSLGDAYYARNMTGMLIFCALFGFGGSLISAMLSKTLAKRGMGVKVIEEPASQNEKWLVDTVAQLARSAGIGMPEVGIFPSHSPNAFATGFRKNSALVAVSVGLLEHMDQRQVRAVLAHEIGHVANGDMVTLSLIQGVINTFVMFFARIIGSFIDNAMNQGRSSGRRGIGYFVAVFVAEAVLGILASVIVAWFSRKREYRADAWGAKLASPADMISALDALRRAHAPSPMPDHMQAFGISGSLKSSMGKLLATHPPLEDRIKALQENRVRA